MENSLDTFKGWILNSAQNKKIFISQLTWPSRLGLSVSDYIVQVHFAGEDFIGHGSDLDSDMAILKAAAEAFERYCVTSLGLKNSNGCAVHTDIKKAETNALLELIERDCFLVSFINGSAFKEIDHSFYNARLESRYKLVNYSLASKDLNVALTRITIDGAANILGLGIAQSLDLALEKSEIEALRQLVYVVDKDLIAHASYDKVSTKKKLSFDDHGNIALTRKHYEEIAFIFEQGAVQESQDFNFFDPTFTKFKIYDIKLDEENPFYNIPLYFVKANNVYAQELFAGSTFENINPLRIQTNKKLNLCLHPFR